MLLRIVGVLLVVLLVLPLATCHRGIYSRTIEREWRAIAVESPGERLLKASPSQVPASGASSAKRYGAMNDPWERQILILGRGRVVQPGDIVQIRVIDEDADPAVPVRETRPVWYWVGSHLERTKSGPPYEPMNAGAFSFGIDVLRANLVGLPEGTSISVITPRRASKQPPFWVGEVVDTVLETAPEFAARQQQRPKARREMLLVSDSAYRIDILRVCPSVLRRLDADHISYGWWGDFSDPTRYRLVSRRIWLELARQCPGEPEMRIRAGPVDPAATGAYPLGPAELDGTIGQEPPRFDRALAEYRRERGPTRAHETEPSTAVK